MKTGMRLHAGQNVTMTPQLVQSIRMLQLSAPELELEVSAALERNVMLELEEESGPDAPELDAELAVAPVEAGAVEVDWDAALAESWERKPAPPPDDTTTERAAPETTRAHLRALAELPLMLDGPDESLIAAAILDAVDENGYLERSLESIRAELPADAAVSAGDMERVLAKMQQLDPPGFCARSLEECLALQLRAMPADTPGRDVARWLVTHALDVLARRDYVAVDTALRPCPELLATALHLVRRLDARPAAEESADSGYVVPDLVVRPHGGGWRLELNRDAVPRVRVNPVYERLLAGTRPGGHALRDQLQEARWLVRGLEMRHETLLKVGHAIFERQGGFLAQGDEGMKPLTLKEIADAIGMHESTVSRITTRKFVQTPRGMYELKYFFSSSLAAREGSEASGTAVRAMIRRLIENEDAAAPLCDGTLAALLARSGIRVARRTVAKYREAMRIAPAKLRALAAQGARAAG